MIHCWQTGIWNCYCGAHGYILIFEKNSTRDIFTTVTSIEILKISTLFTESPYDAKKQIEEDYQINFEYSQRILRYFQTVWRSCFETTFYPKINESINSSVVNNLQFEN